jgi:vacuolar protein sorting-associated protein 35
MPLLQDD